MLAVGLGKLCTQGFYVHWTCDMYTGHVLCTQIEVHKAHAEVYKAHVELHTAYVEPHKAYAELHKV